MFATESYKTGRTPEFAITSDARALRLLHEHRKLSITANNYVLSHPALVGLGDDPVVSHLISSSGFGPHDVVVVRLGAWGKIVTAICVPTRIWRDADLRAGLLDIKREAEEDLRTRCIVVPQRWLRANIRGSVARVIAQARHTRYSPKQMTTIIEHLLRTKISTLAEAAAVIPEHEDPFGAILAMAAQGYVGLDRSAPLKGGSWLSTRN